MQLRCISYSMSSLSCTLVTFAMEYQRSAVGKLLWSPAPCTIRVTAEADGVTPEFVIQRYHLSADGNSPFSADVAISTSRIPRSGSVPAFFDCLHHPSAVRVRFLVAAALIMQLKVSTVGTLHSFCASLIHCFAAWKSPAFAAARINAFLAASISTKGHAVGDGVEGHF